MRWARWTAARRVRVALLAIGEDVVRRQPAVGADHVVCDRALVDQLDQVRARHAEQVRRGLRGQLRALRHEVQALALGEAAGDLQQCGHGIPWQLDRLVLVERFAVLTRGGRRDAKSRVTRMSSSSRGSEPADPGASRSRGAARSGRGRLGRSSSRRRSLRRRWVAGHRDGEPYRPIAIIATRRCDCCDCRLRCQSQAQHGSELVGGPYGRDGPRW